MSLLKKDKLNLLHARLPEGAVVPSRWLQEQGYSKQLIYKYVKSGWLVRAAPGAFCRPGTEVAWQGVVASWQHTTETAWHVGGETALNLQGHALKDAGKTAVLSLSKCHSARSPFIILAQRKHVYEQTKAQYLRRWNGRDTRKWDYIREVHLNPEKGKSQKPAVAEAA
jgi:hypothetical protein